MRKLVRSKLHWDPRPGQKFSLATDGEDFQRLLREKLIEERDELDSALSSGHPDKIHHEIVDLIEVLFVFGEHFCSVNRENLLKAAAQRREFSGDFGSGVVLETP